MEHIYPCRVYPDGNLKGRTEMTKKLKTRPGFIISKKRKADFFNGLELYMSEYKRKFLAKRDLKETSAAVTRAS